MFLLLVVDFMIGLLDQVCVGQFAKMYHSEFFVCSVVFLVEVNHGSQLSRSAPPSFSFSNESRSCNGVIGHHLADIV